MLKQEAFHLYKKEVSMTYKYTMETGTEFQYLLCIHT